MIWLWIIAGYIGMELFANLSFRLVFSQLHTREESQKSVRKISLIKGVIERLFLVLGMLFGFPQVIIAFGALKIGTRFQSSRKISNDYFLIGNFLSLLFAMLYVIVVSRLWIG